MMVERIGDATLYLGDCRDILPTLGKVACQKEWAIITDPPYGIGYKPLSKHSSKTLKLRVKAGGHHSPIIGDDVPFDASFLLAIGVPAIIWGAHEFGHTLPRGRFLVWDKREGTGTNNFGDAEIAWCSNAGVVRVIGYKWNGLVLKSGLPEAERTVDGFAQRRVHSTQKPIEVMEWCVGFVPNATTILDPFMGSGTTGVACARLGRKFVGIELHEPYFDIACRRIEDAYRQADLFVKAPVAEDPADARMRDMFREPVE